MPWYRIPVSHGPGHQSKSEDYRWSDKPMSKDEKEDWFNEYSSYMNYAIGKITIVKKLPKKVKEEKLWTYKARIKYAKQMLNILKETEVRKSKRPTMSRETYLRKVKFDAEFRRKSKKKIK